MGSEVRKRKNLERRKAWIISPWDGTDGGDIRVGRVRALTFTPPTQQKGAPITISVQLEARSFTSSQL